MGSNPIRVTLDKKVKMCYDDVKEKKMDFFDMFKDERKSGGSSGVMLGIGLVAGFLFGAFLLLGDTFATGKVTDGAWIFIVIFGIGVAFLGIAKFNL